ncbi:MAG: hypothetical protein WAM82_35830 [Thermoanaerobaculia bacterium]
MAPGPVLIFDKSSLESLNRDEAVWLDNFFVTNLTPLFFVETLADLEKQARADRTAEQVVGDLAEKTPDLNSYPNVHHQELIKRELGGHWQIEMEGRPLVPGGQPKELEGRTGIVFRQSPEAEAFSRWQRREFLELERTIAKAWRHALFSVDFEEVYHNGQSLFQIRPKPRTLIDVVKLSGEILDEGDKEAAFRFSLNLLGVHPEAQNSVLARWQANDCPPLRLFAPYCRYIAGVDLFFYLALAADLIYRHRPSHKVDLAYLYYLPFCKVFTSKDKLHRQIVPFFLRSDQDFVWGEDLKAELRRLDEHFSAFSEEIKAKGLFAFASHPPTDTSYLVTRLWDKHLPSWRRNQSSAAHLDDEAVLERHRHFMENARPIDDRSFDSDKVENIVTRRKVSLWKGKWQRLPAEVGGQSGSD